MNRRSKINKILHTHIDVNHYEDYTNYKELITAIEKWHDDEVDKLNKTDNEIEIPFCIEHKEELTYSMTNDKLFCWTCEYGNKKLIK
tara:strand:- start:12292 stop:12552 length:261 start_codon:yes stop_codon:yes gene_type:complete